jgi:hypothetical protein
MYSLGRNASVLINWVSMGLTSSLPVRGDIGELSERSFGGDI